MKFWPSCTPGKGVCGRAKYFWLHRTTASVQCLYLSEHFFHCSTLYHFNRCCVEFEIYISILLSIYPTLHWLPQWVCWPVVWRFKGKGESWGATMWYTWWPLSSPHHIPTFPDTSSYTSVAFQTLPIRPKFNQLETVTTFTYKPSLVRIDARNFKLSW